MLLTKVLLKNTKKELIIFLVGSIIFSFLFLYTFIFTENLFFFLNRRIGLVPDIILLLNQTDQKENIKKTIDHFKHPFFKTKVLQGIIIPNIKILNIEKKTRIDNITLIAFKFPKLFITAKNSQEKEKLQILSIQDNIIKIKKPYFIKEKNLKFYFRNKNLTFSKMNKNQNSIQLIFQYQNKKSYNSYNIILNAFLNIIPEKIRGFTGFDTNILENKREKWHWGYLTRYFNFLSPFILHGKNQKNECYFVANEWLDPISKGNSFNFRIENMPQKCNFQLNKISSSVNFPCEIKDNIFSQTIMILNKNSLPDCCLKTNKPKTFIAIYYLSMWSEIFPNFFIQPEQQLKRMNKQFTVYTKQELIPNLYKNTLLAKRIIIILLILEVTIYLLSFFFFLRKFMQKNLGILLLTNFLSQSKKIYLFLLTFLAILSIKDLILKILFDYVIDHINNNLLLSNNINIIPFSVNIELLIILNLIIYMFFIIFIFIYRKSRRET